jgi:hypothetical protein
MRACRSWTALVLELACAVVGACGEPGGLEAAEKTIVVR